MSEVAQPMQPTESAPVVETDAGDERKQKREKLRSKYDVYLKESTKESMSDRHAEALERLKLDPDASEFNLVSRTKGDQKTGLIILNRLSGRVKRAEPVATPVPVSAKHVDDEEMSMDDSAAPEPEPEPAPAPAPTPAPIMKTSTRSQRVVRPRAEPRAPRPRKNTEASEAVVVALSNKVDALWRKLEHMKAKKKERKLDKAARRTMKELLITEKVKKLPKTATEDLFDRLDQSRSFGSNQKATYFKGSW